MPEPVICERCRWWERSYSQAPEIGLRGYAGFCMSPETRDQAGFYSRDVRVCSAFEPMPARCCGTCLWWTSAHPDETRSVGVCRVPAHVAPGDDSNILNDSQGTACSCWELRKYRNRPVADTFAVGVFDA